MSDKVALAAMKAEYGRKRFHKGYMGPADKKAKDELEEQIARLEAKIRGIPDAFEEEEEEEEKKKGAAIAKKATPPQPEKPAFPSERAELAALKAEYGKKRFHKAQMSADDHEAKEQLEELIARLEAKIEGIPDAFPENRTDSWVHELKKEEADAKASTRAQPEKKDKAELAALKHEYSKKPEPTQYQNATGTAACRY